MILGKLCQKGTEVEVPEGSVGATECGVSGRPRIDPEMDQTDVIMAPDMPNIALGAVNSISIIAFIT
ncbi:hypothetical protein E4T56_gene21050 [Termitomyces sp. T112]|nr:hypothetical protein E4T56_gene21050 [Termitomyces sp. T112]